ncbi:MAG TPA: hypothetical protein VF268_12695, partial [Gammaproteobacteria bacterium]
MKKILFLVATLLSMPSVWAETYTSLYGFSLGDSMQKVKDKLGEPSQAIDLDNGLKVYAFIFDDHYAAFASQVDSGLVYSIQLTGEKNPKGLGLDGIDLGSSTKKAIKKFGKPDHRREATDLKTGEQLPNTFINFYGENFSFEEVDGKVSSLKITYDGVSSSDNPADEKLFDRAPREVKLLRDFILEKDYPEVFEDKHYRVAVENMLFHDLDNDGNLEAIVHFKPHYRQSPTVIIYQIGENDTVTRVKEGLAPGPLVPLTGNFLDSHALGQAMDFTAENKDQKSKETNHTALRDAMLSNGNFGMAVQYKDFIHADMRKGGVTYIDMTETEPYSKTKSCEDFEFSLVDQIDAGYIGNDKNRKYIVAVVG